MRSVERGGYQPVPGVDWKNVSSGFVCAPGETEETIEAKKEKCRQDVLQHISKHHEARLPVLANGNEWVLVKLAGWWLIATEIPFYPTGKRLGILGDTVPVGGRGFFVDATFAFVPDSYLELFPEGSFKPDSAELECGFMKPKDVGLAESVSFPE